MRHYDITGDPRSAGAALALEALARAGRMSTSATGVVAVPNSDGTYTVIGGGQAGGDSRFHVGDTVAPGRPTGISARCVARAVVVEWDGSLDGGVPADFDRTDVLLRPAGGTGEPADLGSLYAAGSVTTAQLDAGTSWDVTAVAYDAQNNASPESDPIRVEVTDPIADAEKRADELSDKVDRETQAAKDAADAAAKRADEAGARADAMAGDITEVKRTVTEQGTKIEGAVSKADASLSMSTETKASLGELSTTVESHYKDQQATQDRVSKVEQTADGLSAKVTQATDTATDALDRATSAVMTAEGVKSTVEEDYVSKADADTKYSTKSELEQRASGIEATVTEVRETADAAQESAASAKLTADGLSAKVERAQTTADGAVTKATEAKATADGLDAKVTKASEDAQGALTMASEAQQTASGLRTEVEANYLSKGEAGESYYSKTEVDQRYDSIDSRVLAAESRAGALSVTPLFLRSPSDKGYWAAASYWQQVYGTSMGDGWAYFSCDRTGATAAYPGIQVAAGQLKATAGGPHTMLVEMRGMQVTGAVTLTLDSTYAPSGGAEQHGVFEPLTELPVADGTRRYLLRGRDAAGVTGASLSMRAYFAVQAGGSLRGYLRLCLFRGDLTADESLAWRPYVEPQGTLVRQTAQGLSVGRTDGSGAFTGATYCDIDGSAFRVVGSGGTVLSRFAADAVELGRNDTGAKVRLCGNETTFEGDGTGCNITYSKAGGSTRYRGRMSFGYNGSELYGGLGDLYRNDGGGLNVQWSGGLGLYGVPNGPLNEGGYLIPVVARTGTSASAYKGAPRILFGYVLADFAANGAMTMRQVTGLPFSSWNSYTVVVSLAGDTTSRIDDFNKCQVVATAFTATSFQIHGWSTSGAARHFRAAWVAIGT